MRTLRTIALAAVLLAALTALPTGSIQAAPVAQANMLRNPDFEGTYAQFAHFQTAIVADKWLPWWTAQTGSDEAWKNRMPEYKPAAPYQDRIHSGGNSQQLFTYFGTHIAGVYQTVGNTQPGAKYRFTIWGQAWAGGSDDPHKSDGGPINMRVGIDPYGGGDPYSANIVWSGMLNPLDQWAQFTVEATARQTSITVFTWSAPSYPSKHNDAYWDDAALVMTVAAVPTKAPTNTPRPYVPPTQVPPTATAVETATPTATLTSTPTSTPVNTPTPTMTPTPTWTPTPVTGVICVLAFDDRDGSRFRESGEPLLPYAVFTLSDAQHTLGTYSTNGLNEPFCFAGLEPAVYFVSEQNPPGYESTTHDSWGISLHNGATVNIEFGDRTEMQPTPTPTTVPTPTPTEVALLSMVGNAVLDYSGIIIIVLAAGMFIAFNVARRG